jgi:ATP-dependent HslUV protease ATP-binding subunit HslU
VSELQTFTPREVVSELDRYIVGQDDAKRAVAVALRNRWRRLQVPEELRDEIAPKNIIMIGPTGVGKTEVARRLAKMAQAPFIKVEASKFTEVGYVGRDVESIIRDLADLGMSLVLEEEKRAVRAKAEERAEERLLDALLPPPSQTGSDPSGQVIPLGPMAQGGGAAAQRGGAERRSEWQGGGAAAQRGEAERDQVLRSQSSGGEATSPTGAPRRPAPGAAGDRKPASDTREKLRKMLRRGDLDEREVDLDLDDSGGAGTTLSLFTPQGVEEMGMQFKDLLGGLLPKRTRRRRMRVRAARDALAAEEAARLVDMDHVRDLAISRIEESGIVFIDELDKVTLGSSTRTGPDISREGVQRDLLPIVEGSTVQTKHGPVRTDHILFIAAGAFHVAKPSDLIPELQGRFPIRVELSSLSREDFVRILSEPRNSLVRQYTALLRTEDVEIGFEEPGIRAIAEYAALINERSDDIGARRLHTVMEKLLEEMSFNAPDLGGTRHVVDEAFVRERLETLVQDEDLSRFIL